MQSLPATEERWDEKMALIVKKRGRYAELLEDAVKQRNKFVNRDVSAAQDGSIFIEAGRWFMVSARNIKYMACGKKKGGKDTL